MTTRPMRSATTVMLAVMLALAASNATALAAKESKKADTEPPVAIETLKGKNVKMAGAKLADRVTRISDTKGDQVMSDGTTASDAPAHSDLVAAYVSPIKVPSKLLTRMADDYPRGAVGAFYGNDADWSKLERAVFVALQLAKKRPGDAVGQQVEVGLAGDGASPVQVGAWMDPAAGVERFSLSGLFTNGTETSGTTDVSGRVPGDPIEYYNTKSGVFGFYDPKKPGYFLIMPLRGDNESVVVTLRTNTEAGEIIDRLELPGGGHHVDLGDPAGGFDRKGGTAPLACRALETFTSATGTLSLEDEDEDATVIRYSAGADPMLDPEAAAEALAALDSYGDTIPVQVTPLDPEGEPLLVDASLTRAPALGAFMLSMEVPPGTWSFEVADGVALSSPSGEALIDHSSLTGQAGVRTGTELDGFVSGDRSCARWYLGPDVCDFLPEEGMADLLGMDPGEIARAQLHQPDGTVWCVGADPATGQPHYIAGFGTAYYPPSQFVADTAGRACEAHPVELGAEGVNFDCSADGYENHFFRVIPEATAAADPDGGLLVSIDMGVDAAQPHGERYDADAAMALFGEVAASVAQTAVPAGSATARADTADADGPDSEEAPDGEEAPDSEEDDATEEAPDSEEAPDGEETPDSEE